MRLKTWLAAVAAGALVVTAACSGPQPTTPAPGATHAPHHVPQSWIAKYKGKFYQGWDALREETLARQLKLGVVPAGTKLAPKPEAIKDWPALSADEKKLFTRQMEIFAGFGEYPDTEIGRLIDAIGERASSTTRS